MLYFGSYNRGHFIRPFESQNRYSMLQGCLLRLVQTVLLAAMGNCITLEDTNGNRKLLKKRYEQKIDAVAAMMDAYIAYKLNRDAFE